MKLQQAKWANVSEKGNLVSLQGEQPIPMQHSYGTALPLLLDSSTPQKFGADLIRFAPGKGVGLHTHVGAHILSVTKGTGILVYKDERHPMFPGMIYLIESNVPHAIEAETELVIIAIGNDHRPAVSPERLEIVNNQSEI
ncbi:MAG: cupin domain-containing protein [Patescibacteria group bacterium]